MNSEILEMAKKLGDLIKNSEEFKKFKDSKNKVDSDENLKSLRAVFDEKREKLNQEISKEEYDKDEVKKLSDDLRSIYEKINEISCVLENEDSKEKLDDLINEVHSTIYEQIYEKNDYSYNKCNGSCDSCSGCF